MRGGQFRPVRYGEEMETGSRDSRASLRYRDDRYGEFSGSVGRQFDQDLQAGAYVASAAYAKGVTNIFSSGRDALFEAGLELRYDPRLDSEAEVGAFVKATIELI